MSCVLKAWEGWGVTGQAWMRCMTARHLLDPGFCPVLNLCFPRAYMDMTPAQ